MNIRLWLMFAWVGMGSLSASAITNDWVNTAGGSYATAGNWSPASVPGVGDHVRFTNAGDYTVTFSQSVTNDRAWFNATGGVITLDLGSRYWSLTNSVNVSYGQTNRPEVVISGGALTTRSFPVSISNGSWGAVTLQSVTGEVSDASGFNVGWRGGTGAVTLANNRTSLRVFGGGTHSIGNGAGSVGAITVNGGFLGITGTVELGKSGGMGTLDIAGGTNLFGGALYLGRDAGSRGILTMSEPGAYLSAGLNLGDTAGVFSEAYISNGLLFARGETKLAAYGQSLLVLAGGSYTNDGNNTYLPHYSGTGVVMLASPQSTFYLGGSMTIGHNATGRGDILISNGTFNVSSLTLGQNGSSVGSMYLYNGTTVVRGTSANPFILANTAGSTGLVVLADERALLTTPGNNLVVGHTGDGTMIISNGTANVKGLTIAGNAGSRGRVIVEDGTLLVPTNTLVVGGSSTGVLIMAGAGSYLESSDTGANSARLLVGSATNGQGFVYFSNGTARLRQLLVAEAGYGYAEIGPASVTVYNNMYIPNALAAGKGTGVLVMTHADAFLSVTQATTVVGSGQAGNFGASGTLIVSNGTLWMLTTEVGSISDGSLHIGAATVTVFGTGGNALRIGQNSGTGRVTLAHSGSRLEVPAGELWVGGQNANGEGHLIVSNGQVLAADLQVGRATRKKGRVEIYDGSIVLTGGLGLGYYGNTTCEVVLAHARSVLDVSAGAINVGRGFDNNNRGSNTLATMTLFKGSVIAKALDVASSSFGDTGMVGRLEIYNATNILLESVLSANAMNIGGRKGATGTVVLAEAGSVLRADYGGQLQIGNSGDGRLIVSNGLVDIAGALLMGNSSPGYAELNIVTGMVRVGGTMTIAAGSTAVVNLVTADARLELGTGANGGLLLANGAAGSGTLNLSNGTVYARTPGILHTIAGATASGGNRGEINIWGGTLDLNGGTLVAGNRAGSHGLLNMYGGTTIVDEVRLLGTTQASTGTVMVAGGVLYLGGLRTIGSGANAQSNVWFSGGTIRSTKDFATTLHIALTNAPGPGLVTFDLTNAVQFGGVLYGPGSFDKTGSGTMILYNTNTFAGPVRVQGGVLSVQNGVGNGLGSGGGTLDIQSGGLLAGTGSVVRYNLGGGAVSPGITSNHVGRMTVGQANWTNGTYRWEARDFSTTNWDTLIGTGTLTIAASGVITVQVVSVTSDGIAGPAAFYDISQAYTAIIATATSIAGFNTNRFVIDVSQFVNDEGANWSITNITTNLCLVITPPVNASRVMYWDINSASANAQGGSGIWGASSNTWLPGGTGSGNEVWDNSKRDKMYFPRPGTGPYTVRVDIAVATNSGLRMSDASNFGYVMEGTGVLSLVGKSQNVFIEPSGASMTLSTPLIVADQPLTKVGAGYLILNGPSIGSTNGIQVAQGRLVVGAGGTGGELGGGVVTLLEGGRELIFNRSSYAITNPISGGQTYFTNTGGGYAWAAGATQDFAVLRNSLVVTQQSAALVFTNYLRIDSSNTEIPSFVAEGGSLNAKLIDVGYGTRTSRFVVSGNALVQTPQLNIGYANSPSTAGHMTLSNGTVEVATQMFLGRSGGGGTAPCSLTLAGGTLAFGAASYLIQDNGFWVQTGGVFTNPTQSAGNNVFGRMDFQGGTYYQGGDFIQVVGIATKFARVTITNDAEVRIVPHSTNFGRHTAFYVGAAGNAAVTGELVVAGGNLILTNGLGRYFVTGVARSNNGEIVLGNKPTSHGIMRVSGGSVRAYQIWMGGHKMRTVSADGSTSAGLTDEQANSSKADLFLSGGEIYTLRGISNNTLNTSTYTNLAFSGGTMGALGPWATAMNITLTNSPGPGLTRFDPNGFGMVLAGTLLGPGGLSCDGDGTLVVSANNSSLAGLNFVSNGFLEVRNGVGLALGTNWLTVTAGGQLGGTGAVNLVSAQNGGTLAPGIQTNAGSLTAGNTIWSNTAYRWEVLDFSGAYGTDWDRYRCTGALTIASGSINTIRVTSLSAAGVNGAALNFNSATTYTQLIASAVSISGFSPGAFVVDTSGFLNDIIVGSVELVGGTNLAVVLAPGFVGNNRLLYWDADRFTAGLQNGTGLWNDAVANWRNADGFNLAWNNSRQDYGVFGGAVAAGSWTATVSGISSATNIGMSFLSGGSSYTVAGTGYLSFVASSVVTADAPGTVDARLEGLGFTKVGPATLTLGGSNRFVGLLNVSNGAVRITNAWALGDTNGSTVVSSGAELQAAVSGSSTIRDTLTISGSGTNGLGALRFTAGTPTWVGTVTVAGASTRIGVDAGLTATLSTVVTGGVANVFAAGPGRLMVNGGVQLGSGQVIKDGSGVLSMRGPSAYSGGTIISQGTVRVCGSCAANVMGTATILMENNTVLGSETAASTIVNPLSIWGSIQLVDSTSPFDKDLTITGAVDLNSASRTITVPNGVATLSGPISAGGLNKRGAGTLILGGANTYASPTIVSNGNLVMNGTNSSSAVTTLAGTTLLGSGSLAATTLNGTLDPGAQASAVGAIRMDSLNLRPSSSIRITITNATAVAGVNQDTINCVGTLTVSATAGGGECVIIPDTLGKNLPNFNNTGTYAWKIIDAGALSGYENTKFTVSTASFFPATGGGYFVVTMSAGDIYLQFVPATVSNLKLTVTDTPDPVGLSNVVTYALTVTNLSPSADSPDMVLTNYLDSRIAYVSSSAGGSHLGGGVVTWALPFLPGGSSTTVTLQARALIYGICTNAAHVSTAVAEVIEDDNRATNTTEVLCDSGLVPTINPPGNKTVVVETPLTFSITAFDSGCYPPDLVASGLPDGASFSFTNNYPVSPNTFGNFSWTPYAGQTGTFPIRFIARDAEENETSVVIRIYVAGVAEGTNAAGVPVSQLNWHVPITNLTSSGNDATVVWLATNGIAYDVYTSVDALGAGGMSWTPSVSGVEAGGSRATSEVTAAEARRYFKVVLQNEGVRDSNGIWAVFRPIISPGFNLYAAPLYLTNLSFAGTFGSILGSVLNGDNGGAGDGIGDEVFIFSPDGATYYNLYLDGGNPGVWRESGSPSSRALQPGQGFIVLRNSVVSAQPVFTAQVGNMGTRTNTIVPKFNLIGLSEGWYNVTFNKAFTNLVSGTLNASWDEEVADQILILNTNGAYSRFWRAPDGWRNAATDQLATTNVFTPGRSFYFKRYSGDLKLRL